MARSKCDLHVKDDEFTQAVAESVNVRQVLLKMNIAAQGGNYRVFYRRAERLGLDTSHFTGAAWNGGKVFGPKKSLEYYLVRNCQHIITSHALRKRLIREGIKAAQCEQCLNTVWQEQPIPLELDHIDGDHTNNLLDNLRLLCPNCHAQTSTYRSKNRKKRT